MSPEVQELYGNKLRVRVCGLLEVDGRLLLINHRSLAPGDLWTPPGGGLEFGESAVACIQREFLEETGLVVDVQDFRFACEFIRPPLHAVELFFSVKHTGGSLTTGADPEMKPDEQLIQSVEFLSWNEIAALKPGGRHGIFNTLATPSDVLLLSGYVVLPPL